MAKRGDAPDRCVDLIAPFPDFAELRDVGVVVQSRAFRAAGNARAHAAVLRIRDRKVRRVLEGAFLHWYVEGAHGHGRMVVECDRGRQWSLNRLLHQVNGLKREGFPAQLHAVLDCKSILQSIQPLDQFAAPIDAAQARFPA